MKVKIGESIHDSAAEPVMVILSPSDKGNITSMMLEATCYASFPDGWGTEAEMLDWMEMPGAVNISAIAERVEVCEQNSPGKIASEIAMLRAALVGLIGADTEVELRQMEATMRLLPAPEADKAVSINAIHALLATMGA